MSTLLHAMRPGYISENQHKFVDTKNAILFRNLIYTSVAIAAIATISVLFFSTPLSLGLIGMVATPIVLNSIGLYTTIKEPKLAK